MNATQDSLIGRVIAGSAPTRDTRRAPLPGALEIARVVLADLRAVHRRSLRSLASALPRSLAGRGLPGRRRRRGRGRLAS